MSAKTIRMEGTAARVQMGGSINLVEETQDLRVRVLPQLTTATAVAGAAVANPVIGLATLVIQKILGDPVEEIAARTYHVTGTWTNPLVRRILRQDSE